MFYFCLYNCFILFLGKELRLIFFFKGGRGKVGWDGSVKSFVRILFIELNDWDLIGFIEIRKLRLVRFRFFVYVLWVCSLVFLIKCFWFLLVLEVFIFYWIVLWKFDVRIYIWLNCSLLIFIWLMFLGGGDRVFCFEGIWKGCELGRKRNGKGRMGVGGRVSCIGNEISERRIIKKENIKKENTVKKVK